MSAADGDFAISRHEPPALDEFHLRAECDAVRPGATKNNICTAAVCTSAREIDDDERIRCDERAPIAVACDFLRVLHGGEVGACDLAAGFRVGAAPCD